MRSSAALRFGAYAAWQGFLKKPQGRTEWRPPLHCKLAGWRIRLRGGGSLRFPHNSQSQDAEIEGHLGASHGYLVADCTSGTITVWAEPCNSMAIHSGGRAGFESGPLNFS